VRSRAAVVDAARTLFMEQGYAGTTMDDIARRAGLTKRTLYNNYVDKEALFRLIVSDVIAIAETFARELRVELATGITTANLREKLHDVAVRMAAQFAYLVVGETLDRAMITGVVPSEDELRACAHDGVETFLSRPQPGRPTRAPRRAARGA